MAVSDRNARRADDAERARHIASSESVAFATMLLGLLNDADTVLHRLGHELPLPALDRAAPAPHPMEAAPGPAPADHATDHQDQHAGAIEAPATDASPPIHADAATLQPAEASTALDAAPSGDVSATPAFASSTALSGLSADHASSQGTSTGHDGAFSALGGHHF